ncbi:unnamed protein product [marine sediment metagenome]|uniref:Uncharacterized protein n=1 Tax=marine sediment metagenome TaxID=412755 RepID=X0VII0_9ZZZZ
MTSIDEYEKIFEQNGWAKYMDDLYNWYRARDDINDLIKCIKKIEKKEKSVKKAAPTLKLKDVKEAEVYFNKETDLYELKTPESSQVGVGGCSDGEEAFTDGFKFGCRDKSNDKDSRDE